jgi:hypothetical protein
VTTELDIERTKTLAAATIQSSLTRAADGDPFEIAWLSSKSAQKWLDILNIPQSSMLARTGWMNWAHHQLSEAKTKSDFTP